MEPWGERLGGTKSRVKRFIQSGAALTRSGVGGAAESAGGESYEGTNFKVDGKLVWPRKDQRQSREWLPARAAVRTASRGSRWAHAASRVLPW